MSWRRIPLGLMGVLLWAVWLWAAAATAALAHDVPRSQVALRHSSTGAEVTITASVVGFAHELPVLLDSGPAGRKAAVDNRNAMAAAVAARLTLAADGNPLTAVTTTPVEGEFVPEKKAIRLRRSYRWDTAAAAASSSPRQVELRAGNLFPIDPAHTVFVNIYDADTGALEREAILTNDTPTLIFEPGSQQSAWSVARQFVREGIHHIFIGPDHILFIVGLMLLGGSVRRLLKIVTAFTIAHSITLVLATLNVLNPSPRLIEPVIALSIVFVGIQSLMGRDTEAGEQRDLRLPLAFCFGLIHGFGFANVLRDLDMPRAALGWSLFSFNIGVEIGQACIVLAVAPLLSLIYRRSERAGRLVVFAGSWGVILAGAYWFGERLAS